MSIINDQTSGTHNVHKDAYLSFYKLKNAKNCAEFCEVHDLCIEKLIILLFVY